MKIKESRIRKLIKSELSKIYEQMDAPMRRDPDVIAQRVRPSRLKSKSKSLKPILEDYFTWDNKVWKYLTGDDNINQTASQAWEVTKDEAGQFADDPAFYSAWMLDKIGDKVDDGLQFTEDQIDKIPGIDNFPAWFATSLKTITDPMYRQRWLMQQAGLPDPYRSLGLDFYDLDAPPLQSVYTGRELGHPAGSTTEYKDDLDNKFTQSGGEFSGIKGMVLPSSQLKVDSVFEAVDLFYNNKEVGNVSYAKDFIGDSHPGQGDSQGNLRWGPGSWAGFGYAPQYIWLAKKLKDEGYDTFDKIKEILSRWLPPGSDVDQSPNRMKGFVSPFYLEPDEAARQAKKIMGAVEKLSRDSDAWKFRVYYCDRDLRMIRDTIASIEAVDIPMVSWLAGGFNYESGDGYQDCFLVHYTDDPRFLIQYGNSANGAMVFRLKAYSGI